MAAMVVAECAEKTRNPRPRRGGLAGWAGLWPNPGMRFLPSWRRRVPRTSLSVRIFLAVFGTGILVAALVGMATHWNFSREFLGYLNDVAAERMAYVGPRLERAYADHGSWDFLREEPRRWFHLLRPVAGEDLPADANPLQGVPPTSDLTGASLRLGVVDSQNQWVAGFRYQVPGMQRLPVRVDGRTVGWLVLAPFQSVTEGGAVRFGRRQAQASLLIAGVAGLLAALIAWWVSRRLLAPVRRVAAATHRLAAGAYDTRVEVDSTDEVGQLARDFNALANTLARHEALRRDFLADVSHELRTPLAVLAGEVDALVDGIRPVTPQALASLRAEVERLGELVNDLNELALSDAGALSYRMAPVAVADFLARRVAEHRWHFEQHGLDLRLLPLPAGAQGWLVQGDEGRLQQLLDNLLANSYRYTDAPGRVEISLEARAEALWVEIHDSPPGVPQEELSRLFERLYRVEGSRSRGTGGAGLGLSICRNIALAHGGHIEALASPLGGVCVRLSLPRLHHPTHPAPAA